MTGGRPVRILVAAALVAAGAACASATRANAPVASPDASVSAEPADTGEPTAPDHPAAFFDPRSFELAIARAAPVRPAVGARGLVVPHHWLAGHLIVAGLRDLVAGGPLDRVVLLGPNHIGAGGAPVSTSGRSWSTPFGRVDPDRAAVDALVGAGIAVVAPAVLTHEHGVAGLIPAVAALLPGVRVVPLAVTGGRSLHEVDTLATALAALLDGRTAVVASVDFAHYVTPEEAEVRDAESLAALMALDTGAVLGFGNEHLDSPASIAALMETMRRVGATTFERRADANSAELVGRTPGGVTSYLTGFYRLAEPDPGRRRIDGGRDAGDSQRPVGAGGESDLGDHDHAVTR